MKWYRIWALTLRHIYLFPRSFDRITDAFFWPILDVALWGFATQWLAPLSHQTHGFSVFFAIMLGLLFWRAVWQSNYEIGFNLIEECWNRNFTNLFSTPVKTSEWLAASFMVGVVKLLLVIIVTAGSIWAFHSINVFSIGWSFIPALVSLILTGWTFGLIAASLILTLGIRAQALAWTLVFLFSPLSAVYYPVSVLPSWLQTISYALPSTYVFEFMRAIVMQGDKSTAPLVFSFLLNGVYFSMAISLFYRTFEKTRERGFDHLE